MLIVTLCLIIIGLPVSQQTQHSRLTPLEQCGNDTASRSIPTVCVAVNTSSLVLIPWSALRNDYGQKGEGWQYYYWYLTTRPKHGGWAGLVDDESHKWRKWGTSEWARWYQRFMSMNKTQSGILVSVNLTSNSILPSGYRHNAGNPCWGFYLWAYWSTGTDPAFYFMVCENPTPTNDTRPVLNSAALQAGFHLVPSNPCCLHGCATIATYHSGAVGRRLRL